MPGNKTIMHFSAVMSQSNCCISCDAVIVRLTFSFNCKCMASAATNL